MGVLINRDATQVNGHILFIPSLFIGICIGACVQIVRLLLYNLYRSKLIKEKI